MNNEIKEILDWLKDFNRDRPFGMSIYDRKILSNYITNLQQENERLKRILDEMGVNPNEVFDYKSRCEKAIELLELKQLRYLNEDDYRICTLDLQEVKDILQNGSENNE